MDATQQIEDPFSEEEEEEEEEKVGRPERERLATLKVFKNDHIPETEFPLYVGENVLGRDPAACSVLLPARSVSGRHAVISISVFRSSSSRSGNGDAVEALLWDMGSMNGTRKGRFKLTPQVRYALTEGESVVIADVPCQYIGLNISKRDRHKTPEKGLSKKEEKDSSLLSTSDSESKLRKGVQNGFKEKERSALPPVPLWSPEDEEPKMCSPQPAHKHPEITLVPESDSDSDGESDERKDFVSDSASSSHLCSSTNSSFLTPGKKVIPESEDESSITPSSASMDRFRLRETSGKPCSNSSKPGLLALNFDSDTDVEENMEESKTEPEVQPELATKVEPVPSAEFHMDSDTDVEEEDPEASEAEPEAQESITLEKSVSSVGLQMDSDTDVEEEEKEKSITEPKAQIEQAPKVGPVPSAEFLMDSDTDVEEEEPDANKAKPEAQNAVTLDKSVSSVGLHMDSDTEVEEEEEESKTEQKALIEEAPKVKSVPSADLHMDSDTDVEENEAPITENVSKMKAVVLAVTESTSSAPPPTEFNLDSDTDVEDDNPMKVSMVTKVSHPIGEGSDVRPTSTPGTELHMDSDTDVDEENEDKEKIKARDLLSNSETDDEDPFKPVPGKAVKVGESQKAYVGGKAMQSEESSHKKQDHHSQAKTCLEEPTQAFGNLEDWDLPPTQVYGAARASAGFKPKQLDLEATQAYATETDREEEQEKPLTHTQLYSNLSTAETQFIPVANVEEEDEETSNYSHLSTADTIIIASTPRREEQTQPFSLFTAQTQLIWEGEDKEFYQSEPTQLMEADIINETQEGEEEENMKQGRRIHGGGKVHKGKHSSSYLIIAETQPMCEEEEAPDVDLSGDSFQKPSTRQQPEKCDSAYLDENKSCSHVTIAETQPMGDDGEEAPDQDNVISSTHTEKPTRSHITITETQPMFKEDHAPEDDLNKVNRRQTDEGEPIQQTEKDSTSSLEIPETQHVGEDDEEQEKVLSSKMPSKRSRRGRPKKEKEASQPAENVVHHTITETQLMCEEEQASDEDLKRGINNGVANTGQQTDEKQAETGLKSFVTIAETQPMCEEEEAPCEDLTKAVSTGQIDEHNSTELPKPSSSHFIITETQPMHEQDEGQEKHLSSKTSSRSSRRGKPKKDNEVTQTSEVAVHHTITETQPVPEEVIERDEDLSSGIKSRRSHRGRKIKEDSVPPLAEAAVSSAALYTITETQPVCEDGTGRDENLSIIRSKRPRRGKKEDEGEPAQSVEPNSDIMVVETQPMCEKTAQEEPSGRSSRRHRKDKTEVESKTPSSGQVQGKTRKGQEGKRKKGKALSEEESEEEKTTRRRTRRTGIKHKCIEKEEEERLEERNAQAEKERMEKGLQEQEERERVEREEKERLERERKVQDERERAETEMRQKLEREQQELEEKERLKREEEKIRKENERIQREKDRFEREEKEKLERESRKREEQRQKEEERFQMEKEQKEKERIAAESEQLEKEKQENEELQMRAREQKETEDGNHQEAKMNERLEKDKTGLETPLVPPARRSRRCSSSSINSEQSVSSQQDPSIQRGPGRGRGRGRGRQTTIEQPISARQSSQRGLAFGVEDIEQDSNSTTRSRSCSSSRSSERSANSVITSNQGTRGRGRGRKSVKLQEPQEVSQAKTSGKGRGRGGRHSGLENVNVGMSNELEQDAEMVNDTAVPQSNSRGRKRAANTSTSTEEAPSPTPKTPRRSVSSQAYKVLFTGLTDEDGERVVSRLGGSLARGVNDMTHLVTDKARRTVKFLCAVARGVPIVNPDWLKKCGKVGHFLSTDEYILKDVEQEKKFSFSLQKTLLTAQSQPLLKGYEIHVTPSVMPEPSQMKEIITCCGARFLPKMPSAQKKHTVVVSCEQDRALCQKAVSMSLPVVSTEFLLTGILQQRVDLQVYSLTSSLNTSNQPAAPKAAARGRRK
ncbi:mediator of DNA damage checkpoint protein 1 isoform X2 [Siphateles boraxobius]